MNEHENETLIRRWLEAADGGFPADFGRIYRGERSDRRPLAVQDKVVLRLTTTAMHTGEFQGIAPTGRRVTFTGMVIYRIENGRIAESWGEIDFGSLWRQLTTASAN